MIVLSRDVGMTPLDVWSTYMAINLHFKQGSKYDAFKFSFKGAKMRRETFETSKNKWTLEKLSKAYPKKNELILYFLSNTLAGNTWIGGMDDSVYQQWIAKIQRLDYTFKSEMSILADLCNEQHLTFDEAILPADRSQFPLIYSLYQQNKLSLESLVILESILMFTKDIARSVKDPLAIISDINHKILKYKPFLISEIKTQEHKKIVLDIFTQ